MDHFKSLPEEITLDILSRLPTESILDSKLVCKNWKNIISHHPSFYQTYLHHLLHPSDSAAVDDSGMLDFLALTSDEFFYYVEYNEAATTPIQRSRRVNFTSPLDSYHTRFVGSCNGLICLAEISFACVCNPITREYVVLPEFNICSDISFGYVSSTNEYKVVGIWKSMDDNVVDIHVYTLGSGSGWRNLGNFYSHFGMYFSPLRGTFADGALYWLDEELQMIVSFDLAEEKFCKNLSPPTLPPGTNWWDWDHTLGVLDGFLYIALFEKSQGNYNIWLLKKKKDNQEEHQSLVWCKEFRDGVYEVDLLAVTKSDGVLCYSGNSLNIFYYTNTSTLKKLVEFEGSLRGVSLHKNTLVSLKELGEEDTKAMESVEIEETRSRDFTFEQLQEGANPENI